MWAIDADAHVDENKQTWAYLEGAEQGNFSPVVADRIMSDNARRFYGS